MTSNPEATTPDSSPASAEGSEPATVDAAAADPSVAPEPLAPESPQAAGAAPDDAVSSHIAEDHGPDPVLDAGTFERVKQPRAAARLPLGDGTWHQLARQYVIVQLITSGIMLALIVAATLVLVLILGQAWAWIPGGILAVIMIWVMAITPRQAKSYGYQLRKDDLVFRRGILWQRVVAVPYGRMQLVDITHGPLDRGFKIAQLKLVTAAATTAVTIPGLTQEAAERLRDTLIDVAETRRTGL